MSPQDIMNNPDATNIKFVPDPFRVPHTTMYCTGDLVKWNSSGELIFLGRTDNQIKINGYRIELDEIQNVINSHKDVSVAVVTADNDGIDYFVTGYYVSLELETETLRRYLRNLLPAFMVPRHIIRVDAVPLTSNGKLDKSALPKPIVAAKNLSHQPYRI